jgi:hypothetical protein
MSGSLALVCLLAAGAYLLVVSFILDFIERRLRLSYAVPKELKEETGFVWTFMNFTMEALFYVAIPSFGYSFLRLILPLETVRAGFAAAMFAFILGAAPVIMSLSVRLKLPMPFLLFLLLSHLIKLAGCLTVIGLIYAM